MKNKKIPVVECTKNNAALFHQVVIGDTYTAETKVVVPETHTVFVIKDGVISETLSPGTHNLFDGEKGFWIFKRRAKDSLSLKVVFISKTALLTLKWGTPVQNRVNYVEPKTGLPIDLGFFGELTIQVADPKSFYLQMVTSNYNYEANEDCSAIDENNFFVNNLKEKMLQKTIVKIADAIRLKIIEKNLTYFQIEAEKTNVQNALLPELSFLFADDLGFKITDFVISNINTSPENKEKIEAVYAEEHKKEEEKRTYREARELEKEKLNDARDAIRDDLAFKKEIAEDEDALYERQKAKERNEDKYERANRHEDEDRAFAREDKAAERASALREKELYYEAVKAVGWEGSPRPQANEAEKANSGSKFCSKCGKGYDSTVKFCSACGTPTDYCNATVKCGKCGAEISVKESFCHLCGNKMK